MNSKTKSVLVARLRFPEFREAGEWECKTVGEVFRVTRGEVLAMPRTKEEPSENHPYPVYSSQTKNNGLAGYYSEYLYEDAITWTTDGANAGEVNFRKGKFYCTNVCGVLLNSEGWANLSVAVLLNSVTRKFVSYVGNPKLMNGVMSEIVIPFPSLPEQQKIADCLSSLDELIAAEAQKLDALKTHKKGLMQQIFPAEGETVPHLRFPEFREAGEWEEKALGKLVEIRSGNSPSQYQLEETGANPFVKVEDLNNCEKYQANAREYSDDIEGLIPCGSVIFPKRGAAIALNKVRVSSRELLMDTNMMALTPDVTCQVEFLFYYLSQIELSRIADNSTIPQINNKHIIPFGISVPLPEEQQEIANCLSSLDELIATQARKINALKTHKKGLMQGLFPDVNGSQA
jgi:type I restriction enzyme S subunit